MSAAPMGGSPRVEPSPRTPERASAGRAKSRPDPTGRCGSRINFPARLDAWPAPAARRTQQSDSLTGCYHDGARRCPLVHQRRRPVLTKFRRPDHNLRCHQRIYGPDHPPVLRRRQSRRRPRRLTLVREHRAAIGRITMTGAMTSYPVNSSGAALLNLTLGTDGAISLAPGISLQQRGGKGHHRHQGGPAGHHHGRNGHDRRRHPSCPRSPVRRPSR